MKAYILTIGFIVLITSFPTFAQEDVSQVLQKLQDSKDLSYHFTLTTQYPNHKERTQEGFFHKKGNLCKFKLDKFLILLNEEGRYIYDPELDEIQIHNSNEGPSLPISLERILEILENDLQGKHKGSQEMNDQKVEVYEFIPKQDKKATLDYFKVKVALDQSRQPAFFTLYSKDGSIYSLAFEKIELTPSFEKETFLFKKEDYPSASIEDLRL